MNDLKFCNYQMEEIDGNIKLFVVKMSAPATWVGLGKEVSNWIIDKLKE